MKTMDIWVNKIGPYTAPTESYGYYDAVPWCRPAKLEHRPLRLGETLAGDLLVKSGYNISFQHSLDDAELCEKSFKGEEISKFVAAIRKRFVYELLLDDLPMKLFVGELSDDDPKRTFLYTQIEFVISVNGPHIIEVSATPGNPVEIKEGIASTLRFSYSVKWEEVCLSVFSQNCSLKGSFFFITLHIILF